QRNRECSSSSSSSSSSNSVPRGASGAEPEAVGISANGVVECCTDASRQALGEGKRRRCDRRWGAVPPGSSGEAAVVVSVAGRDKS
ncbi:hypothetical protein O3P69_018022, partial [Scylla paramamosain]